MLRHKNILAFVVFFLGLTIAFFLGANMVSLKYAMMDNTAKWYIPVNDDSYQFLIIDIRVHQGYTCKTVASWKGQHLECTPPN